MPKESHSTLQDQLYAFQNFKTFIRLAILLSGDIKVNPGSNSNLCDGCGKRVGNVVKHIKKCTNMRIFETVLCNTFSSSYNLTPAISRVLIG